VLWSKGDGFRGPEARLDHQPHVEVVAVGAEVALVWTGGKLVGLFFSEDQREIIRASHRPVVGWKESGICQEYLLPRDVFDLPCSPAVLCNVLRVERAGEALLALGVDLFLHGEPLAARLVGISRNDLCPAEVQLVVAAEGAPTREMLAEMLADIVRLVSGLGSYPAGSPRLSGIS
jgi:hypothetical protein